MTVHVFDTMGTVVSIRTADDRATIDRKTVEGVFERYDRTYSLYDTASPLSQVARGDLPLAATAKEVRDTYALALEWRQKTGGLFTPHRPDGVIDLSGIVKALAIRDAGALLDGNTNNWLLTVGGDLLGRASPGGAPWNVGIVDPDDATRLAGVATVGPTRRALATSGIAERGEHIWNRNGPSFFAQATVAADDIITADVLATAIIAGRPEDLDQLTAQWDVDVMTIDREGRQRATPGSLAWTRNSSDRPAGGN